MISQLGKKFKVSKTLEAPNNEAVSAYIKAVKDGQAEAEKFFKKSI